MDNGSPEVNLKASPGRSPLGKQGLLQSPTGVRCRKPIAVAEGLTGDSPSFRSTAMLVALFGIRFSDIRRPDRGCLRKRKIKHASAPGDCAKSKR
jgi:hypothetical protein